MALLVWPGDADLLVTESFCTVDFAGTYHGARLTADEWDNVDDQEIALRVGTDWMSFVYGPRSLAAQGVRGIYDITSKGQGTGDRKVVDQRLPWPKLGETKISIGVRESCAEAGLQATRTDLWATIVHSTRNIKSRTIGPLKREFFQGFTERDVYPAVEGPLIRDWLIASGRQLVYAG